MDNIPTTDNNPGDLKNTSTGAFNTYSDPQAGFNALTNDLNIKMNGQSKTGLTPESSLSDFASIWAPDSDGNNSAKYASDLASQLGVPTTTPIGSLKGRVDDFAHAIAQNEGFHGPQVAGMEASASQQPTITDNNQPAQPIKMSVDDFAAKIKEKYPQYQSTDNTTLVDKILAKYPQYASNVDVGTATSTSTQTPQTPPPSKEDFLGKVSDAIQNFFPGKQVGTLLGGLYDKLTLPSDEAKDVTLPSAAQVGADVGQGALMIAGGPELDGLGTGAKIAEAGIGGALYGGANAVAGGSTDLGDIGKQALIGGTVGAATGGLLEAGGAAVRGISDMLSSRSADEIAAMARDPNVTPKDVSKLSPSEQEQYFKEKTQAVNEDATAQRTQRAQEADQAVANSKQEIAQFSQKAADAARGETIDLKQPLQQLLRDSSQTYVQLTQEAAASGEGLEKDIDTEDVKDAIDKKFRNDETGLAEELKNELGLNKPEPEPEIDEKTGLSVIRAEPTKPETITNQDILDKAKEIMQTVSKGARSGGKVYSAAEYRAMQKYSTLMEILGDNGVDMKAANDFWRSWATLRDRSVTAIRPFDAEGTGKMSFQSTLRNAAQTATTVPQAQAKLDAQNFISQLEERMKLPPGTIGSDTRDAIAQLEKAKLDKAQITRITQEANEKIAADKAQALKDIGKAKYNTQAAARKKGIILKVIGTVVGLGALGTAGAGIKHVIGSVL